MKTIRCLAMVLLLLSLSLPALASQTFVMMGAEEGEAPRDWSQSYFFERMEALTGVGFTFDQYTDLTAYQAAKEAAFASGDLPDVLFKARLTPQEEMAYLESGQLVDLAPYLAEHAPNLHTILEARPDWRQVITQPNGAIASLPILNGADRQCCIWINRVWLENLGLDMPDTIDAYTDVLRAFRDQDPNANGRQDEVPLSLIGPWEAKFLLHAWGLAPNDYNIYVDDGGQVQFAPFDPAYRDFVAWLRLATEESLISADTFRTSQSMRTSELTTTDSDAPLTLGSMVTSTPYMLIDMQKTTDYSALPPLSHGGEQVFRQLLGGVGRGTFAVTSACEDVPAVLRWVDYLYTEEGGRLAFAGLEGEDYVMAEDGTWNWASGEDYIMLGELVDQSIIAGDAVTPGLEPAAFMRNTEIVADNHARRQVDTIRSYMVEPYPVTWPTDAAREARIAELQEALATHVDTAIANFAMGKVELTDGTWQAFLDELHDLGAEEFVDLWQAKLPPA